MVARTASLLTLTLLATGCAYASAFSKANPNLGGSSSSPTASEPTPQATEATAQAFASAFTPAEQGVVQCEHAIGKINSDLSASLDKAQHDSPRPGVVLDPPGKLLAKLKAAHVDFAIDFAPTQWMPQVDDGIALGRQQWRVPPQGGKERAEFAAFQAKERSVGWIADELRAQVSTFGTAFYDAHLNAVTCDQAAELAAATILGFDVPNNRAAFQPQLGHARDVMRRLARAQRVSAIAEAAATGVFAAYQAAAANDHTGVVDDALEALASTLPIKATISDAEADDAVARMIHTRADLLVSKASQSVDPAYTVATTRDAEADLTGSAPTAPSSTGGAAPTSRQGGSLVQGVLTGAAKGALRGAIPKSYRPLADAMEAVTKGDYKSAVKNASDYVPGPLGGVLKVAVGLFGS
jgi:hypothetical protein